MPVSFLGVSTGAPPCGVAISDMMCTGTPQCNAVDVQKLISFVGL